MNQVSTTSRYRLTLRATAAVFLGLMLIVSLPGCGGCLKFDPIAARKKAEEDKQKDKKKKKPKDPFEVGQLVVQPTDATARSAYVKPGHWMSTLQSMKANEQDFVGQVETATVDQNRRGIDIPNTPFQLTISRPISLPKGQGKLFETNYYIQPPSSGAMKTVWLLSKLQYARGRGQVTEGQRATASIPAHQYFMVVLSPEPDRYAYLKQLYCINPPFDPLGDFDEQILYYRIVMPPLDQVITLPSNPLAWTSIAYVVWDGVDPGLLSPEQQQSLLDWLHFGGQLVISGPDSLDRLQGSFLAPYLPAEREQTVNLVASDFETLNQHWSIRSAKTNELGRLQINPDNPPQGVKFKLLPQGQYVADTGQLVVERRIGGGRIVVTSFALSSRQMRTWPGFDGFFNSALLRRPSRKFQLRTGLQGEELSSAKAVWVDPDVPDDKDSRLSSTVRYFSRDISLLDRPVGGTFDPADTEFTDTSEVELDPFGDPRPRPRPVPTRGDIDDWHFCGYAGRGDGGVASWNDRSGVAEQARQSLREAAGISIPQRGFVLKVLLVYLLVLVPVNWAFFRVIGRVEWAWVAAPLIAIVGAAAVIQLAQLDIGFARSHTEIGVVEAQGDYHRAHLTRYSALYTSLSSTYDLHFSEPTTLAMPFFGNANQRLSAYTVAKTVNLGHNKNGVTLSGFQVDSNLTRMVHSEQMFDLGGSFTLNGDAGSDQWQVSNGTKFPSSGTVVLRRHQQRLQAAWVGDLAPKTATGLRFEEVKDLRGWPPQWEESPLTGSQGQSGQLNLRQVLDLGISRLRLQEGDYRLIGWTDQSLPGMIVRPAAAQIRQCTMILVHLQRSPLPQPKPDRNLISDVQEEIRSPSDEPGEEGVDEPIE